MRALLIVLLWATIVQAEDLPKGDYTGKVDISSSTASRSAKHAVVTIDRTGFTADTDKQIFLSVEVSQDGGMTWQIQCGPVTIPGGTLMSKPFGSTAGQKPHVITASVLTCGLPALDSRQFRGTINVKTDTGQKDPSGKRDETKETDATLNLAATITTK